MLTIKEAFELRKKSLEERPMVVLAEIENAIRDWAFDERQDLIIKDLLCIPKESLDMIRDKVGSYGWDILFYQNYTGDNSRITAYISLAQYYNEGENLNADLETRS